MREMPVKRAVSRGTRGRAVAHKSDRQGLASLDSALKSFLKTSGLAERFGPPPEFRAFKEAAGASFARHARAVRFARGELVVQVSSAPHLAELKGFRGEEIRVRTNQLLGRDDVRKITFRLDR
jgi:hypothetical protein